MFVMRKFFCVTRGLPKATEVDVLIVSKGNKERKERQEETFFTHSTRFAVGLFLAADIRTT